MMALALFDLDHTLLDGDTDVLWCEFLMDAGVLERERFSSRNRQMEADYQAGLVSPAAFSEFYVSTLAGQAREFWQPWRERFLATVIVPRIGTEARGLVEQHRTAGDRLVMTTATSRYLTELTAAHLGFTHLLATEVEEGAQGFTGRTRDVLNMREGKVLRLTRWMAEEAMPERLLEQSTFYSDSHNDLPLLRAVGKPVAVNPDATLTAEATTKRWKILRW